MLWLQPAEGEMHQVVTSDSICIKIFTVTKTWDALWSGHQKILQTMPANVGNKAAI